MLNVTDTTIQELMKSSKSSISKGGAEMLGNPAIQELIAGITKDDENGISIIECLLNGKITDEEIAEETEIRLNIVRRILYKLYDAGLASYKRSKDPETQWYTYSWRFEENRIFEIIEKKHEEISRELRETLDYEENNLFFTCRNNGCRYNFEEASENNFICPDCGDALEFQDNSTIIMELKEKIN